jgi:hypothetical protein
MKQDEINAVKKAAEKMRKQESAQDEIIRFAIQCRLVTTGNRDGLYMDALTEFANLVAAKEQEAFEKMCDEVIGSDRDDGIDDESYEGYDDGWFDACNTLKFFVKKRGEA